MEHFDEGVENRDINEPNDSPESSEPSDEAKEQDGKELEQPEKNEGQESPSEEKPDEENDGKDVPDDQPLAESQGETGNDATEAGEPSNDNPERENDPDNEPLRDTNEEADPSEPEEPEGKKPEDEEPEDEKLEDEKPEDKKPEDEKPEGKKPEDEEPEDEKPEDEEPEDEEPEDYYDPDEIPDEPIEHNDNDPYRYDDYTDDEIRQLEDDDPGYINDDVLDYDHPDYISEGNHHVKWQDDSADTPHRETLEPGTRLSRVGDENGRYMADSGIDYDDRQLPTYEGKKPMHEYEVVKPLEVDQSTIAKQDWAPEMQNPDTQQYKTDRSIKELLDDGYLREVPSTEDDGTDWSRTSLTPQQEAQLKEMEDLGELEIPKENLDWQEPVQKEGHLPTERTGSFEGERGNSAFHPNDDAALSKMNEYGKDSVDYKNGDPDFSPFTQHDTPYGKMDGQVEIPHMTANRENPSWEYGRRPDGTSHDPHYDLGNFAQADNALSEKMGNMTPEQVEAYRKANNLTWHECPDGKTMQLVPTEIHDACRHSGGVSEQKYRQAMGDITAPTN